MGLVAGCGDGESRVAAENGAVAVFTAPNETVLTRVGGDEITVGDFRHRLEFETAVHKLTMIRSKNPPKDAEKRLAKFTEARARQVLPQLVHCALLDRYLDEKCGGREVEGAEKILEKAVKRYGKKIRRKDLTLEGFAAELGVEPAYLRDQFLLPAREDKARLCFDPASTNVTEKEIDEGLKRMDAYTEKAVASNRVTWATCSNVLAQVRAGADFATIGKSYGAEDTEEATEWGWFNRDDFDMMAKELPAFKEWAFAAKVGDIGGPFDIDDGLSIVKVVGRQDGTEAPSEASKQVEEVQLVRINFVMIEENPEPRTREHCREALLNWKARKAQERLFKGLFNETKIEYPNGTKIDFRRNGK